MASKITSPAVTYTTSFGDLTVHVHDETTLSATCCGVSHSTTLPPGDDRLTWYGWCAECLDELHAYALKINPRRIVTEIAAGPDGIRTRCVIDPAAYRQR